MPPRQAFPRTVTFPWNVLHSPSQVEFCIELFTVTEVRLRIFTSSAPASEEEMDKCEQVLAAEPEAKEPFVHLPEGAFLLDEFKHKYSIEDTLSLVLPYFWEHSDKDGWSLWYSRCHFPEELTQTFVSCNLITGMFQQWDKPRKNVFASALLFGTNTSISMSGVWVFRGQDLAFPLSPDWQVDYEPYTWILAARRSILRGLLLGEWERVLPACGQSLQNQGKILK
ncbi:elongation factor 1-gamma-like [Pteronotus mesoamericanus]|uniref:elongation factor 1-gamma-like n=1 Tax=Pteronotus mesoamericanus TaxID=1884717 RepID=UPI0023ED272B|nr:elongation factor 1-gamma-like [Pteronotus parnellii mesoamericanus]